MIHDGHNASTAAALVGYESQSQFSREFKRLFGTPPAQDVTTLRNRHAAHGLSGMLFGFMASPRR